MLGDVIFIVVGFGVVVTFGVAVVRYRNSPNRYTPWTPAAPSGRASVYRLYGLYRSQVIGTVVLFALIALMLVAIQAAGRPGPGWGFTSLWVAGVAYLGYMFLFRVVYELELSGDLLLWKAPLRSGHAPVVELRSVRPRFFAPNAAVIEFDSGMKLQVIIQKGFQDFARDLSHAAPGSVIEPGVFARVAERFGGPNSGYERRD